MLISREYFWRKVNGSAILFLWVVLFIPFSVRAQELIIDPSLANFDSKSFPTYQISASDYSSFQDHNQKLPNGVFSLPKRVSISSKNVEHVQIIGDRKVIAFNIQMKDALGFALIFDNIRLGNRGILTLMSEDKSQQLGGFNASHIKSHQFMPGLFRGDNVTIFYSEPIENKDFGSFEISRIDQIFDNSALAKAQFTKPKDLLEKRDLGFNSSLFCNKNINCPSGAPYRDVQRSVMRIIEVFEEGIGFCTGALINNTKNDGTPYVLSANHCQDGLTPLYHLWRFDFNYEAPECFNPAVEPSLKTIYGAQLRSNHQGTDFMLVELSSKVPPSYNVFFAGWDRRNYPTPKTTAMIHHPFGDIKKISIDRNQPYIYADTIKWIGFAPTLPFTHYSTDWDEGTMQPGSSGAPLFNDFSKIIGQLHGGGADCAFSFRSFFGIFNISWNGGGTPSTGLKTWLDPMSSGKDTLIGIENPNTIGYAKIRLRIITHDSIGIPNLLVGTGSSLGVKVTYQGNGYYVLDSIPLSSSITILPTRDTLAKNGITIQDVVLTQKHVLGVTNLSSSDKILAADVSNDQRLSVADVLELKKLLLDKITFFVNNASWRFDPPLVRINNIFSDVSDIVIFGTKIGDVDYTRDVNH
ncbi:MAG: hypothetical protein IPQ18_03225 [Saprospiraceae bacterium]|nr:hypothetical protein [Saprospiraceae bacterium]